MKKCALVTTKKAVIHATDMFGYGSLEDTELMSRWTELDKGRSPSPAVVLSGPHVVADVLNGKTTRAIKSGLNMCKALRQSQQPTKSELQQMLKNCSKVHSQLIKEAAMGLGFDRHLFALKLIAEKRGLNLEVFNDPAYKAINQNILSTSTLASDYLELGAFGPVVQNGYGIGYSVWNDRLGCIITNYSGHSDGLGFLQALEESLNKIEEILRP
ncbi:Carnitine O-palmitoyltransferase 2, mitochondrial [Homalodisca vitripennis]|nr:Carnitine O-palmitoyltransferase 2, mitochondrial [Homalodisca vitripennis]